MAGQVGTGNGLLPHSPLGGSGAYRWMVCPGSVIQSEGIEDEESDDAALGTCAHTLGERCLNESREPWLFTGQWINGESWLAPTDDNDECDLRAKEGWHLVDRDMVDAVQFYIGAINLWHPKGDGMVEHAFHCPSIHELFYGRSDYTYIDGRTLHVWDYKHGIGIVVEAPHNPQLMYYAAGVMESLNLWDAVDTVVLHIVQPRGWHIDGQHRYWETTPDVVVEWLEDKCIPAMNHAMVSRDTKAGLHCRFCPARQAQCPALMEKMAEYMGLVIMADRRGADALTAEQLGTLLALHELGKIVAKAANKTAYARMSTGIDVPHVKLVKARKNRVYKDGADVAAVKEFGDAAMTEPEVKSPAQIDELPGGKAFTARWAFKPEGGTTIAPSSDPRRAVKRGAKALFRPVKEAE